MHSIRKFCTLALTIATLGTCVVPGAVSAIEPAVADAAALPGATVSVLGDRGAVEVSVAELEAIGLKRVMTVSPWEKGELIFEGILFREFLEKVGLGDAKSVRVTATDNYTQTIPRKDWIDGPLLLATRQNGKPLTLRTQGPTRLVYPLLDHPQYDTDVHKRRWVWAITTIERVQ